MKLKATKGQRELLAKTSKFLESSDRVFLVTGKPGTGKTTIIRKILDNHIKKDYENIQRGSVNPNDIQVAGICVAHKAKNVLGKYIPHVFTFGITTRTFFHSMYFEC